MADLHARQRNALPAEVFGLPAQRKYPMPDKAHAADAKARAAAMVKLHKLSRGQEAEIDAKANRVLGEK
jgi:hypothetical protein